MRKLKKAVVGVTLLCTSGVVVATGCPAVVDSVWQSGMTAAQGTISGALQGMVTSVSQARSQNLQRIVSAIKVLAEQINTSSNNSVQVNLQAKQAAASVQADIYTYKAMSQTLVDFDPVTGQGYNPCVEEQKSKNLAVALGEADTDMQEKVIREIDAAPGRFVADRGAVIAQRMRDASSLYCTADEAAAGLCSAPGSMAGKDVDATNFFTSSASGTPQSNAKSALLNNMFGLPYSAMPASAAKTSVGTAFMDQKRSQDAYSSVAQASLKNIQSWTEARSDSGGSTDNQSVLDALRSKVETYSGGGDYDQWAQAQASQSERGLLVEMAKMMALDLSMEYMEYQSTERKEATVAARLALHASQMPSPDQAVQASNARMKVTQ